MSKPDPTADEIAAELADHLAASASELERAGISTAKAQEQAREKFGDVEATVRLCYWVKEGDAIMFRRIMLALVVLLSIGLVAVTANSWLAQSRMAQQLDKLNEQLASLTKTQESLQEKQKPLSITGLIYSGDKSKPMANAEVAICRLSDMGIVRRVASDARGSFDSGPLPPSDYCLFSPIDGDGSLGTPVKHLAYAQGAPIYLYSGIGSVAAELDVAYRPQGRISLECSPPIRPIEVNGKWRIVPSLMVVAFSGRWRTHGWEPSRPRPNQWPLYVSALGAATKPVNPGDADQFLRPSVNEILSVEEVQDLSDTLLRDPRCCFPEGSFYVGGSLMTDVVPLNGSATETPVPETGVRLVPVGGERYAEVRKRESRELAKTWIMSLPNAKDTTLGSRGHRGFSEFMPQMHYGRGGINRFTISPDGELKLRVEIPASWDAELRQLIDAANDARDAVTKLNQGRKLFHPVTFSLANATETQTPSRADSGR